MYWSPSRFDPRIKPERGTYELDRSHPTARGLLARFMLGEGAGAVTIPDTSGPAIVGTISSGATWGAGPNGAALALNSSTGYISGGPSLAQMLGGTVHATIEASFLRPAAGVISAFGFGAISGSRFNVLHFSDNNIYCQAELTDNSFPNVADTSIGWRRLTLAYNGNGSGIAALAVYYNGVPLALTLTGGSDDPGATLATAANLGDFEIGREADASRYTTGSFDDALVFGVTQTRDEVLWRCAEPYAMFRPLVRRTYSVPTVIAGVFFRRSLTNRTGSRSAA